LKQKVWASAAITFRVITTTPTSPDLVFTLTDFSTLDTNENYEITTMVHEVWQREDTLKAIQDAIKDIQPVSKLEAPQTSKNSSSPLKWTNSK
jgi:hypothetical protein